MKNIIRSQILGRDLVNDLFGQSWFLLEKRAQPLRQVQIALGPAVNVVGQPIGNAAFWRLQQIGELFDALKIGISQVNSLGNAKRRDRRVQDEVVRQETACQHK